MVALIFLLVIAVVFAAILALEGGDEHFERRPAGLLTWIASGNWPAKIGGGLMIVGVGALLRYAAMNFDVPDSLKLGVGIAATLALGIGAQLLAGNPARRAISLALGGAAFGVAYLTAYSAYALFGYLPNLQGMGLLAITAVGAGVFAVSRGALSLAVLSMVGAYMAPAFALNDPGANVVYGYYVGISALTFCMVAVRGWRPLIHLSFLFTLAGGAFFAWTADYFSRGSAAPMLPLIAMLVAVHVAMPLFERRWQRGAIVESLDTIYLLALPLAAALTALVIAPSRAALAGELWWFAVIWFAAAAWLFTRKRDGMATHAVIGLLMLGLGLAARFRNLPWEIVALAVGVSALVLAARRSTSNRLHSFLIGLVLVLAAVHMASALAPSASDTLFYNGRFFERLVGAGLLVVAALTARRLRHTLDSLMLTVAIGWSAFALGAEVARLDLVSAWLLLHWAFVIAAFILFFLGNRLPAGARLYGPLVFAVGLSAVPAGFGTGGEAAWISAILAVAALCAIALRPVAESGEPEAGRLLAAIGAPVVVALWMARYAAGTGHGHVEWQYPLAFAAVCAVAVLLAAERASQRSRGWFNEAADIFAVGFVLILAVATLFDIERGLAAMLLELICVGGLVLIASWDNRRISIGAWLLPVTVIGIALLLQANLLRWLGPGGELNALSVAKMEWPTLVSLLWASIGAALTISARRARSRMQWSAGAAFLVGAAIKLVLLDFGSLGQLANILAVIAAGGVFLLVGWLAPMPPASEAPPPKAPTRESAPAPQTPAPRAAAKASPEVVVIPPGSAGGGLDMPESYWQAHPRPPARRKRDSTDRLAWTIAIVVFILFGFSRCSSMWQHPFRQAFSPAIVPSVEPLQPDPRMPVPRLPENPAPLDAAASALAAPAAADPVPAANACAAWAQLLPANYQIHVVNSVVAGEPRPTRGMLVDSPGHNIVLVLGSAEPVQWKFSVMRGSILAGIWLVDDCAQAGSSAGIDPQPERIEAVLGQEPQQAYLADNAWTHIRSVRAASDR